MLHKRLLPLLLLQTQQPVHEHPISPETFELLRKSLLGGSADIPSATRVTDFPQPGCGPEVRAPRIRA